MSGGQLEVLSTLDKAKMQWYHFTTIVITGMGFFTDACDLFCISTVTKILGCIYYYNPDFGKPGSLPPNVSAAANGVALCTLAGQLFFGWLKDKLGRKKVYGATFMLMVICSIVSGLSFRNTPKFVMTALCFFRFWLGFGIGGDYPLLATIMSEYANKRTCGAFIAVVFAMQGTKILAGDYPLSATIMSKYANKRTCGAFTVAVFAMQGTKILACATISIIVSVAFNNAYHCPAFDDDHIGSTPPQADFVWRLVFILGAILALLTYYWRMKMPKNENYTALVEGNAKQAAPD